MKTCSFCLTINNPSAADWLPYRGYIDPQTTEAVPDFWRKTKSKELLDEEYNEKRRDFSLRHPFMDKLGIQYIIYGLEYSKTGTKHYQMFVVFRKPKTFKYVKKIWPSAHIEHTRGTFREARDYCKKAGKYFAYGYAINQASDNVERDNADRQIIMDPDVLELIQALNDRIDQQEKVLDSILKLLNHNMVLEKEGG
jgi:hypothetical protein